MNTTRDFALLGNITHVAGHHTIRAGAEWRTQNNASPVSGNTSGTYSFDDTYTQQNNGTDNTYSQSNFALSYAAFLMGVQTSNSVSRNASFSFSSPYYGFFGQDTWRLSPKWTITPGLRFELEQGVVEKNNQQIVGWNPTADLSSISGPANTAYSASYAGATAAQQAVLPSSLTIQGGPIYAGVSGASRAQWVNSYRFLPRMGATYQLRPRVVLRAGYGLFFDTYNALNLHDNQSGYSTSTSVPSSSTFGTNFTAPGAANGTLVTDPFPANTSGVRFTPPVGNAAGALYYLGGSPSIYEHSITPAREQRGSIGAQVQFGASTMLDVSFNISRTSHLAMGKSDTFTPESFFIGGQQPNTAANSLLSSQIANPFLLSNFSGVATTNPAAYSVMSHSSYFTSAKINVSNLVRPDPQYGGFSNIKPIGLSNFEELLITLSHRWAYGLALSATLEVNDQHDANYFKNPFDPNPSFEPSTSSTPTRFTLNEVWKVPFGRGQQWLNSGWKQAVFGGYQIAGTYEAEPGNLTNFGNLFYVGQVKASAIKIKHPIYVNQLATGGRAYIQWLNPGNVVAVPTTNTATGVTTCSYSGVGFVTNSSCQPNGYNLRVFPTYINGIRAMGWNGVDATVSRNFRIWERVNLETSFLGYNIFNHQGIGGPSTGVTGTTFGQSTGGNNTSARWLSIQGRFTF